MSSPVNIRNLPRDTDADAASGSFTPSLDLRAFRTQYVGTPPSIPNIPLRSGSPALVGRTGSPALLPVQAGSASISRRVSITNLDGAGSETPPTIALDGLTDEEKARVIRRHLVSAEERRAREDGDSEAGAARNSESSPHSTTVGLARDASEAFPIPYDVPGADVTHDIYKWQTDQRRQSRQRAVSFAGIPPQPDPAFEHIHEPGGFRRNYLLLRANEHGAEEPPMMLNNFIEFLTLYGHFAGEDLEEDEDDTKDDEEQGQDGSSNQVAGATERTPLLTQSVRKSRSRRRSRSIGPGHHGDASVTQAVLMLLKSFVGTGILFLGKAFLNGGLLFSSITIAVVALVSLYSFLLLVKAKFAVSGSYGDIGGTLYGPWMRYAILISIVVSQLGFVCAYTIFVAENLQSFVMGVTHCLKLIPVQYFMFMQLVIFLPLALVRDIAKLSTTALVADAFILAGLIYIFGSEISILSHQGVADVKLFNPKDFSLFIGTAVFSFEGIGLVIPITDSMREPRKFPAVLTGVMLFLIVLFGGGGALSYLTFGSKIQTVVIVNLDVSSKMVQAVQFLYSLAILLSIPLQLFPAIRIMENGLFTRSGKADVRVKWTKNLFRFAIVMFTTAVSWVGAVDLDKFVSFTGSFACIPLCFIYPAMLHYKACAQTRKEKIIDWTMIIAGVVVTIFTTVQTIGLMLAPEEHAPPPYNCPT